MSKKILLLIPNFGFGGAQRVFSDHAKMFSKFNEVEECVFNLSLPNEYETGNVVHDLDVREGTGLLDKALRFVERIKKLTKLKKEHRYDICISHLEGADYINVLSKQTEKNIFVVHGSKIADENISGVIGWLRKHILLPILYKRADLIVAVSDGIKEELIRDFSIPFEKVVSIPNYFNVQNIVSSSKEDADERLTQLKLNHKIILYSGRFAAQKNLIPLFSIFKKTKDKSADVKLVLLGEGELKESYTMECERLGLTFYRNGDPFHELYDVYFLGYFQNPFPCIRLSDVFVMTSKWEGFPMALCEAMAIGSCIMASDCLTGPRQILDYTDSSGKQKSAGVLMPIPTIEKTATLEEWSNRLLDLLADENLRKEYAAKGKERVLDFTEERIAEKWKLVINV